MVITTGPLLARIFFERCLKSEESNARHEQVPGILFNPLQVIYVPSCDLWYKIKNPILSDGVLNEYGTYLLSRLLADSTIGHEGLNFSVRDGKR